MVHRRGYAPPRASATPLPPPLGQAHGRGFLAAFRAVYPRNCRGDWRRGQQLFTSEQVALPKCHALRGAGGKIGPDLWNLIYRDYASVLRDITQPSAAINPEHITYNVELKNGDTLAGVVLEENPESVTLGQVTGANLVIPRNNISSMKASALSLMPEGLWQGLNAQQQRDLMTFLLTAPQ